MRVLGRRHSSGFTLIELLTVIAIIAILAALIMTAVISAQESGRVAHCKNNLMQLGRLMYQYSTSYGGFLPSMWHERWVGELGLVGKKWGHLPDDMNPKVPTVWNNFSPAVNWLGHEGFPMRSGAKVLLCKSDLSGYRCDQGCLVSYMGLAKYGWWHRGDLNASQPRFEYHQIQEFDNPTRRMMLAETEPGTWQYGGCG